MDRDELLRRSRALRREIRDREIRAGRRSPRTHREMRIFLEGASEWLRRPEPDEKGTRSVRAPGGADE
jgi:hypothetical protein